MSVKDTPWSQWWVGSHAHSLLGCKGSNTSYSNLFKKQLQPVIRSKRGGFEISGVLLQHTSALPHTLSVKTMEDIKLEYLIYLPHSPGLAIRDFQVFRPLEEVREATFHKWWRRENRNARWGLSLRLLLAPVSQSHSAIWESLWETQGTGLPPTKSIIYNFGTI